MQTQVANCNHTEVKGNNLRSKSSIHDRNFWKFWKYFFHLIFVRSPFFQNTRSSSQIWIKKSYSENFCPHGNCFKKIGYCWLWSCFQILVFGKQQIKWLQTRKIKLQKEIQKSLDKVVKKLWESCSKLFCWQDVLDIPQNSQKNVFVSAETCNWGIFKTQLNI